MKNLEDLRNSLKLQLNSLRMRKKNQFLTSSSNQAVDDIDCNKKLSFLATKETAPEDSIKTDVPKDCPEENNSREFNEKNSPILKTVSAQEKDLQEDIYSQTNELGLVILDVQGGVEFDETERDENNSKQQIGDINKEKNQNQESPGEILSVKNVVKEGEGTAEDAEDIRVFDQIRKIINKQKSKIQSTSSENTVRVKLAKTNDEDKKMDLSSNSGDNSQSSFPESAEISQSSFIESTGIEEKSPFVSDTLDEFLNASRLNISYQVPKLGAEEGIKKIEEDAAKHFSHESPMILKKIKEIKKEKLKKSVVIKAKTVAQKRRILERERRKELKKIERQRLKALRAAGVNVKHELNVKTEESRVEFPDRGFVLFRDKKIWVNGSCANKCLARIDCSKRECTDKTSTKSLQRKKLSLLYQARHKESNIRYRPGPLSKKQNLQISGNEKWDSHLLKLPKITLEITPKQNKPFCDNVLHRFPSILGGELDENAIEFALTMVKTKKQTETDHNPQTFSFPLQYRNKVEHVLVRRKKSITPKTKADQIEKPTESKNSADPIADVIEGLIKYVEIKELAPTLIKAEEMRTEPEVKLDKKFLSPTTDNNVSVFKKPPRKRSKIEAELLRLNCKVVNVEVEETVDVSCKKPYCELGCVCKSIKCEYIPIQHCQKVSCMFNCSCPQEKLLIYDKLTLPPGTNILSEHAVTRIEDEAKKNLAKIEREFTQTVIHTNDKTIVVGIGSRSKNRRNAKTPAKYTDFVPSTEPICEEEKLSTKCVVSLPKFNLSPITPYCLIHNLYNCYCKGQAVYKPKDLSNLSSTDRPMLRPKVPKKYDIKSEGEEDEEFSVPSSIPVIDKKPAVKKKIIKNPDPEYNVAEAIDSNSNDSSSPSKRPTRNIKKRTLSEDFVENDLVPIHPDGVRVKPVPKKYLKAYKYSDDVFKYDFIYNVNDSDLLRLKLQQVTPEADLTEAELLKQVLIQEKLSEFKRIKNKRKQVLTSRCDEIAQHNETLAPPPKLLADNKRFMEDAALQRRKKIPAQPRNSNEISPVFEGEIIIDQQNMELLKKMGPKTVADGYARLLPWASLINSFYNNTINIWSMIDQPSRLLINKIEKKCPKNYVNIKDTQVGTEVIGWILKNKLPDHYQEDSLSFILKETKDNFEICGICTRNITESNEKTEDEEEDNEDTIKENSDIFYHKDLNSVERFFVLTKERKLNQLHRLVIEETLPQDELKLGDKKRSYLWMRLPDVTDCRWRMIYLNSDFTYLFFKTIKYSIRYTDLLYISDFAKKHKCTVSVKNKDLQKGYNHVLFGIYFDARYSDRIFIGPYVKENIINDVETLRYINKSLVSTESFNRMRGKGDYKCGYWLVQGKKSNITTSKSGSDSTIDLTAEKESVTDEDVRDQKKLYPYLSKIMHNDQEIKIIDAPPRKPEDFNRYIVTNIPKFGYLGAYQHANGEIDVSWPFENKLLRFADEDNAVAFLQERFCSLLQPVPQSFEIQISISHQIDLTINEPINSRVLNGHYICGRFGFYNIQLLSNEDCVAMVNYSKESILKMFAQRAQIFVRKKIENLAEILKIEKNKLGGFDLPFILNTATQEILELWKKEQDYVLEKNKLYLKKRENALKLHKILSSLPVEQRNLENLKFRAILHKTEPIEIHDSDEESTKSDMIKQKSILLPDSIPPKVFKTPSPVTYPAKQKLVSVLKPRPVLVDQAKAGTDSQLPSAGSSIDPQFIKGVKLIKTSRGLVLIQDELKKQTNQKIPFTKFIIQDSKVKNDNQPTNSLSNPCASSNKEGININGAIIIDLDGHDEIIPESNKLIKPQIPEDKKQSTANCTNGDEKINSVAESIVIDVDLVSEDESIDNKKSADKKPQEVTVIDLDELSEDESSLDESGDKHKDKDFQRNENSPLRTRKYSQEFIQEVIDVDSLEDIDEDKRESQDQDPLGPGYSDVGDSLERDVQFSEDMEVTVECNKSNVDSELCEDGGDSVKRDGKLLDVVCIS